LTLTIQHLIGIVFTLFLIIGVSIYAGRQVKSSEDFAVSGRRAGSIMVAGTIIGTLVGSASTIGTAQLAYMYGMSAWWFTLGGGIGCIFLALLAGPLRERELETVPQYLSHYYGERAEFYAAIFVSIGVFFNIVPQVTSAVALLVSVFPVGIPIAAAIAVFLMIAYVFFGGAWGTSIMGVMKIILMYITLTFAGFVALKLSGGFSGLTAQFSAYPWFSLFGRGLNDDLAAAFSMVLGVLSSQIYYQAIFCGRNTRAARNGALLSAFLIPLIGPVGIFIGLFMRVNYPDIQPALAFPMFVMHHLHPLLAGVVLVTLLLAILGTGAGLTLSVSTLISRDIYQKIRPQAKDTTVLAVFRLLIVIVLFLALVLILFMGIDIVILEWSYLSLGLRGAAIFIPLIFAIILGERVPRKAGLFSIIVAPSVILLGVFLLPWNFNPLYPGLLFGLAVILLGVPLETKNWSKTLKIRKN
jgi:SSS family solute:Na+ symporter